MVTESCPPLTAPAKGSDEKTTEILPTLLPGELNKEQAAFGIDQSSAVCPMLKTVGQCHRNTGDSQGAWDDRCGECLFPL